MATLPRRAALAVQIVFIAAVLWFVWASVKGDWPEIVSTISGLRPNWWLIVLGGLIVFSAYLVLIEAWRRLMRDLNEHIAYLPTARIWFVSVLGRYIPGRIWSVAAVAVMAKRAGISPLIATGSALLLTLINTAVGSCILLALIGPGLLQQLMEQHDLRMQPWQALALVVVAVAVILLLPLLIEPLARLLRRITRKEFHLPKFSEFAILRSAAACALAWLLYGTAFWFFVHGLFDSVQGGIVDYVKVYTGSYLAGYVAVPAPGGFGVREGVLQSLLPAFGLMNATDAKIAAWASRVWLTVLEILPGVLLALIPAGAPKQPEVLGSAPPPA